MADGESETFEKTIKDAFDKGGFDDVKRLVASHLDNWNIEEVLLAVIGNSGVGKSTFINAFRDLNDDDEGSAKTGETETTTKIKCYEDKNNPNIKLYDLPGVGTAKFPKEKYLSKIHVDRYDAFVLLTATRYTEIDAWLATEFKARKKPFFFVRTKVWADVENSNRMRTTKTPPIEIIKNIRKECKNKLVTKIYLVDSHAKHNTNLDFNRLQVDISKEIPEAKRLAYFQVFKDVTKFTSQIIKEKGELLRGRIWKRALLSGVVGAVPVPIVAPSLVVDVFLINQERKFFGKQLGIPDKSLFEKWKTANMDTGVPLSVITVIRETCSVWWKELSADLIKELAASEVAERATSFIPVIGPIVSGSLSYVSTRRVLHTMLDKMIKDALAINALMVSACVKDAEF